jgi:translation initiation factor IF-2
MTEPNEPLKASGKKPLGLSRPSRLELKKTVDAGQVRQSFSHGRSKAVSVEVRRKRTFAQDAGGVMTEVKGGPQLDLDQALATTVEEVTVPEAPSPPRTLTEQERAARARALKGAKRTTEEIDRLVAEEMRRTAEREAVETARRAREDEERHRAEEEANRRIAEEARRRADEEAERRAAEQAARIEAKHPEPEREPLKPAPEVKVEEAEAEEDEETSRRRRSGRAEVRRKASACARSPRCAAPASASAVPSSSGCRNRARWCARW